MSSFTKSLLTLKSLKQTSPLQDKSTKMVMLLKQASLAERSCATIRLFTDMSSFNSSVPTALSATLARTTASVASFSVVIAPSLICNVFIIFIPQIS